MSRKQGMLMEEVIQKEIIRLLNKKGYETYLLEEFAKWCNTNLISPKEIKLDGDNTWVLWDKVHGK